MFILLQKTFLPTLKQPIKNGDCIGLSYRIAFLLPAKPAPIQNKLLEGGGRRGNLGSPTHLLPFST